MDNTMTDQTEAPEVPGDDDHFSGCASVYAHPEMVMRMLRSSIEARS